MLFVCVEVFSVMVWWGWCQAHPVLKMAAGALYWLPNFLRVLYEGSVKKRTMPPRLEHVTKNKSQLKA